MIKHESVLNTLARLTKRFKSKIYEYDLFCCLNVLAFLMFILYFHVNYFWNRIKLLHEGLNHQISFYNEDRKTNPAR